ncbi:MAG: serine/threonine-protein phosphatase, partial [Microcoleus sp.]
AVQSWIRLANEKNGYDNTSVVATHCRMSPERLVLFPPATALTGVSLPMSASVSLPASASMSLPHSLQKSGRMPESQLSESSKQLLYPESSPAPEPVQKTQKSKLLLPLLGLLVLMLGGGALGLWVRSLQSPQPEPEQLPPPPKTIAPTPADIPSPGADIPLPAAESPSPSPESPTSESPSPSPESTPAEIPSPSPESTPAEIPLPDAESPSPSPQ